MYKIYLVHTKNYKSNNKKSNNNHPTETYREKVGNEANNNKNNENNRRHRHYHVCQAESKTQLSSAQRLTVTRWMKRDSK